MPALVKNKQIAKNFIVDFTFECEFWTFNWNWNRTIPFCDNLPKYFEGWALKN